eukprot:Gb_23874 [translate_table: standard]
MNSYNFSMQEAKLFLILCFSLLGVAKSDSETGFVWENCGDVRYSNGSVFQRNLNNVLDSLLHNVSFTGFNSSSSGEVYGFMQCRADLLPSDCSECASAAKNRLVESCLNTSGLVQLDGCFLRYENYNFISNPDDQFVSGPLYCNTQDISSDPNNFTEKVRMLLTNITNKAPNSKGLFAAESIPGPSAIQIYAFTQCWRYLSTTACGSCLTYANANIMKCQNGALGAQIGTQTCYLRYEKYNFFNTSILAAPPQPTPIPSVQPPGTSKTSSSTALQNAVLKAKEDLRFPSLWEYWLPLPLLHLLSLASIFGRGKVEPFYDGVPLLKAEDDQSRAIFLLFSGREEGEGFTEASLPNSKLTFKYDTLRDATGNFDPQNKLGEGGFGSVHKGILPDGTEIAIKRLTWGSRQGNKEFLNETNLISRVQHRNLVKLLGCCVEGSERLLVYEYLSNKSLDKILFVNEISVSGKADPKRRSLLDWEVRHEIILGTARGLAYLHEESEIRIIHRDIKASNLLLDDKLKPKIADFGLAKFIAEDLSHVSTRVAGTLGYMAPEYALHGQLTEKADIFSFGVLVLEIVSGRKNQELTEDMQFLVERAWRAYESDKLLAIIDAELENSCSLEAARRVIHIGLLCTQASASLRPAMSRVVHMLTSEQEHLPVPTRPAFIDIENPLPVIPQSHTNNNSEFDTILSSYLATAMSIESTVASTSSFSTLLP